jgi:FlaA1/EpsC-like NDP-sugar epimerase
MRAINVSYRGTVLVPKLDAVRIVDVIDAMREHYEKPNHPIEIIGIRPGEKIHEVLISEEELSRTKGCRKDFLIAPQFTEVPEEYGNSTRRISFGQTDHLKDINLKDEYTSSSSLLSLEDCKQRLCDLNVFRKNVLV